TKVADVNHDGVQDTTLSFSQGGSVTLLGVGDSAAIDIEHGTLPQLADLLGSGHQALASLAQLDFGSDVVDYLSLVGDNDNPHLQLGYASHGLIDSLHP
ncbi:MAG: hypothetical protein J2O44_08540, partial [Porphyrobacter sp.]|nr:hypothetical protein [Porphyrobacter sp.]